MPPDPGKEYTVKCALKRAVPDLHHLEDIREADKSMHLPSDRAGKPLCACVPTRGMWPFAKP
jgi:hypothetical protein